MKRNRTVPASIFIVALMVAIFWLGRQSALLRSQTAGASYRALYLQGVLSRIRGGDVDDAATLLEYSLDEHIALLAELEKKPAFLRVLFVPSRFADQADAAVSRFVTYRTTVATNYTGVPLLMETEGVSFQGYEEVNRSRSRINELIEETMRRNRETWE